ncbi:hypothetical protein [Nonomuraea typhae]|uniref:Uncharacterized protein n=1 Tax=Nonomuraea typhae TaxID=2603600 RepID=A0ABW7ZCR7_9ACTN
MPAENQDEGPAASIVAAMPTPMAAALLASLHPTIALSILSKLPLKKFQAIMNTMQLQTGKVEIEPGTTAGNTLRAIGEGPQTTTS